MDEGENNDSFGEILGKCKRLKDLTLDIIERGCPQFNYVKFIDNLIKNIQTLEKIDISYLGYQRFQEQEFKFDVPIQQYSTSRVAQLNFKIQQLVFTSQSMMNFCECLMNIPLLSKLKLDIIENVFEKGTIKQLSKIFNNIGRLTTLAIYFSKCKFDNEQEISSLGKGISSSTSLKVLDLFLKGSESEFFSKLFSKADRNEKISLSEFKIDLSHITDLEFNVVELVGDCSNTFKSCQKLDLRMYGTILSKKAASKFGVKLKNFKKLQNLQLFLDQCQIQDKGFSAVISNISKFSKLAILNLRLSYNSLELKEDDLFENFLSECVLLEELFIDFSENGIEVQEATKLCEAILSLYNLRSLHLNFNYNKIGKDWEKSEVISKLKSKMWNFSLQ